MSDPEDSAPGYDDIDPTFGPEFDLDADLDDDASQKTLPRRFAQAAWQRLDERKDAEWLREQLSDWDDWDDDAELH